MPSLRTLDVVHRLNAPTRAAATRRRRLRKGVAVAFLLLGAAIAAPSGSPSTAEARASKAAPQASNPAALRGRHVVRFVPATPPPADATRVDVWSTSGTRLIACAPTTGVGERTSADVSSATRSVAVALSESEMARVAKHLGAQGGSSDGLIVSACL